MNVRLEDTRAIEMLNVWIQLGVTYALVVRGMRVTAVHAQVYCFIFFYGHFPQKAKNGLHNYVNFGMSISDIDECSSSNVCHPNAMCNNTVGSYICECSPGYTGDGKSCSGL